MRKCNRIQDSLINFSTQLLVGKHQSTPLVRHTVKNTTVLDTKSQNIPEVVVVRRGAGGALGIWEGWVNWVKGSKWGQFTSNLRGRWTIPITTGGCQVSGRGHKGEAKGS